MKVELTPYEHEALSGQHGGALKIAMSIIARMADFYGAPRLLAITAAHIDSSVYFGEAGLEFAERLVALGAKVAVPSTTNVSALDEHHWYEWEVPSAWASNAQRQMIAYQTMGCQPSFTCAPYQTGTKPTFGQQIAWGESSAIVFANSVLGARTERYPDLLDICAAIAGRVPEAGLHLTENRAGQLIFDLAAIPSALQQQTSFFPVLGSLIGELAGNQIPVITNLASTPTEDDLKALGAASASTGAVALFHIVGITPEAPSLEAACQGRTNLNSIRLSMVMLRQAWQALTKASGDALDLIILGSPHFSLTEFQQLIPLLEGKRVHPKIKFLITTSRAVALLAKHAGLLEKLEAFGAQLTVDTCILVSPMLPPEMKRLMTNSAKYAYYGPGLLNADLTFGSLADCVQSAIEGRVIRDDSLWSAA